MTLTNFPNGITSFGAPILPFGLPFGPSSKVFFVDPANGSSTNDGLTPDHAFASVATAYTKTTSGNNDVIFFIGGATADTLTTALTWSNSYTHLIGLSAPVPGEGQRCRIIGGSTTDLTEVITLSGSGCIFANLKIANETDANADSGALVLSGDRNMLYNVMVAGMLHATPGARAASYSLTLSGSENFLQRCTIGADTITRAAANGDLLVTGGSRNRLWECSIISQSDTDTHVAVKVTGMDRSLVFKDCLFYNFSVNHATSMANVISDAVATTHDIILQWPFTFVGFTGVADTLTSVYLAGPDVHNTAGLAVNPAA